MLQLLFVIPIAYRLELDFQKYGGFESLHKVVLETASLLRDSLPVRLFIGFRVLQAYERGFKDVYSFGFIDLGC